MLSDTFFRTINAHNDIEVWAVNRPYQCKEGIIYKPFPPTKNNRERINFFRHTNDKAWTKCLDAVSIKSMQRFSANHKGEGTLSIIQTYLAGMICLIGLNRIFERFIFYLVKNEDRSKAAFEAVSSLKPDLLLVTNPFWVMETSIALEANKLNIPVISLIPSWDNITTKSRMTFNSDAYFVWSDLRVKELNHFYPYSKKVPVLIYGTPQYEVFYDDEFFMSKSGFCELYGLDPNKKIIVYATGSPNFLKTEYYGAEKFAERFITLKEIPDAQVLIRPHPNKDNNELIHLNSSELGVFVQFTPQEGLETYQRDLDHDDYLRWVNTFRYADVVVNLSSTVILDALAFDKPVININFDPHPDKVYDSWIKEINSTWTHLQTIWDCKAIPQVNNFDEMFFWVAHYLTNPEDGKAERKVVFREIAGYPENKPGKKLAEDIISLAKQWKLESQ